MDDNKPEHPAFLDLEPSQARFRWDFVTPAPSIHYGIHRLINAVCKRRLAILAWCPVKSIAALIIEYPRKNIKANGANPPKAPCSPHVKAMVTLPYA
jgi:hypothetical protein